MSTNELDRFIAENVNQLSYEYDDHDWDKLSAQLAIARRKKRTIKFVYFSSGIAVGLAIILMCITSIFLKKDKQDMPYTSMLQPSPQTHLSLTNESATHQQQPFIQQNNYHHMLPANASKLKAHKVFDSISYNVPVAVNNNTFTHASVPGIQTTKDTIIAAPVTRHQDDETQPSIAFAETNNRSSVRKGINISVAGGVNYGSVHSGYAVGAAFDKKLNNKLGLELTVAYVGNIVSNNQSSGTYLPPSTIAVTASSLNYLQFTPVVGYSLSKKITVSAGADIQRLLQDKKVMVLYNDAIKTAPMVDLGVLVRTEYTIYPRLKAGLSYRLGANNMLAPGNNYFERNYMQVQLKYKLH